MLVFKCKMCGADLVVDQSRTVGTCAYCGSTMAMPRNPDQKTLIPAFFDIDVCELPDEYPILQAHDLSKLDFMKDSFYRMKMNVVSSQSL